MHILKFKYFFVGLLISLMTVSPLSARKHTRTENAGDILQITIPVAALITAFSKDDTEGMKQLCYSVITSTAATWALKFAVHKKRPRGGKYSFPSAHTSLAFTGATFLGGRYGYGYGVPAFAGASYVGYSRVYAKRHGWTDVLGGALVGGISSYIFTTPYQDMKKTEKKEVLDNDLKKK